MEAAAEKAPQLPLPLLLVLTAGFVVLLLLSLRRVGSLPGCFLLVAIWLRVMSGAFHDITFAPIVGGLSINALLSVATVAAGAVVVSMKTFAQRWVMPIYALVAVMVLSTALNKYIPGFIDMFFKWGYAVVLIAATREAMVKAGPNRILSLVMLCYLPILVFQFISVPLGLGKDTEGADAVSYIGGYNHEAAFSIMVVTFVLLAYLNTRTPFLVKVGLIVIGVVSIMLANYRTAIVSVLPLLVGLFVLEGISQFDRKSRVFVAILTIPLAAGLLALGGEALSQRFADLVTLVTDTDRFLKPPSAYMEDEKKILSGRLYIWANYIEGYLNGSDLQRFVGMGPNTWSLSFVKYAHNTLVSYLYELGALGLLALLAVWASFILATLGVQDTLTRRKLLLAQASFLLFNFATMPHWNVEGQILYALLQGTLLYHLTPARQGTLASGSAVPAAASPTPSALLGVGSAFSAGPARMRG